MVTYYVQNFESYTLVDTHCHLLDPRLRDEKVDLTGLEFVVEIGADVSESKEVIEFVKTDNIIYGTVGVHPHFAHEYNNEFENWVKKTLPQEKIVAIGECGLDYQNDVPHELQREVFKRQIKLSHELQMPLVVHSREAFIDTFNILKEHKELLTNGILIHCFSYGCDELTLMYTELDAYFAFGGAITYKYAHIATDAIRACPSDRIVLETDCPYLSPVPLRGTTNEPKNIKIIAQYVANILNKPLSEIAVTTTQNAKRFFRI